MIFFFLSQAVTLHTDVGDIKIELFCERTPKACEVSNMTRLELFSVQQRQIREDMMETK